MHTIKGYKNTEIAATAQELGMTLRMFCETFGLNYVAMRKAVNGHQDLSERQLTEWIKVREDLRRRACAQPAMKCTHDMIRLKKQMERYALEVKYLEHATQQLEAKISAIERGMMVLQQLLDSEPTDLSWCMSQQLMLLELQDKQLLKKHETLMCRLLVAQGKYNYYSNTYERAKDLAKGTSNNPETTAMPMEAREHSPRVDARHAGNGPSELSVDNGRCNSMATHEFSREQAHPVQCNRLEYAVASQRPQRHSTVKQWARKAEIQSTHATKARGTPAPSDASRTAQRNYRDTFFGRTQRWGARGEPRKDKRRWLNPAYALPF